MASETTTGSNIDIVREYPERVFNQHSPDLAAKYRVRWDAVDIYRLAARLQGQPTRTEPGGQDRAVAGQGKASGGLAATGAAPISFADLASKSASARK